MLTAVPSLFIDGEWVASTSGTCSDVVNPSDATVVTEVDVADDADIQRAIAAARPQERMQIRRMADASLALAERRPEDLRKATERLGVEGPTNRQLWGLRIMGVVAPPSSAGILARLRGILIVLVALAAILPGIFPVVASGSAMRMTRA